MAMLCMYTFKEHVQVYYLGDSVKKHGYFMCVKGKLSWSDLTVNVTS
jgi:hypothetical protein